MDMLKPFRDPATRQLDVEYLACWLIVAVIVGYVLAVVAFIG